MPKIVDHEARRRELVAAALGLLGDGGREAVSVRSLASATGWSAGTVRHYLPTTATLTSLLLEHVSGRVQERVAQALKGAEAAGTGDVETAALLIEEALPLDTERQVEFQVWLAYFAGGHGSPAAGTTDDHDHAWAWEGQRMFARQLVLLLSGTRNIAALPGRLTPDLESHAGRLHAYTDGLALRMSAGVEPSADSLRELREFLHALAGLVTSGSHR